MADDTRASDAQRLRRTQRTIALVRAGFAIVATGAIVVVLLNGEHNEDEYEVPGVDRIVQLWQVLAVAMFVLAIVLIGAIAEFSRTSRRRRFET